MNQKQFEIHLEARITRELAGMAEGNLSHLWCDGVSLGNFLPDPLRPRMLGLAWIGNGSRLEEWRLELLLHRTPKPLKPSTGRNYFPHPMSPAGRPSTSPGKSCNSNPPPPSPTGREFSHAHQPRMLLDHAGRQLEARRIEALIQHTSGNKSMEVFWMGHPQPVSHFMVNNYAV